MKLSDFSPAQQEFLAVLEAFSKPVSIELAGGLAPLSAPELVSLIHRATRAGWLQQVDDTHISLTSKIPAKTVALLRKRLTPERCNAIIEALDELNLFDAMVPDALFQFLHRSGRKKEAASMAYRTAIEEIGRHAYRVAYDHQYKAVLNFLDILGESDINRMFFLAVLSLSDLADNLWYTENIGQDEKTQGKLGLLDILNRAKDAAKRFGQQRQLALVRLHLARHYINLIRYDDALHEFRKGFAIVEQHDDEEIKSESTVFYGHYYFLLGRYKQAVTYYEDRHSTDVHREGKPEDYRAPKAHCICLRYLGHIHHAMGLLDSYIQRALLSSMPVFALSFKIMLGSTLLFTEKRAEAIFRLKAVMEEVKAAGKGDIMLPRLYRVLAYYYFLENRVRESYDHFKKGITESLVSQSVITFLSAPWALELFFEYEKRGYEPIPGVVLTDFLQEILNGPNVHFQGVAYRIFAKQAADRGAGSEEIKAILMKSLASLRSSGVRSEMARTTAFIAQIELRQGNRSKARDLALQAWEGLSVLAEQDLPFELRALIEMDRPEFTNHSVAALKNYPDLLNDLLPSVSKKELLNRFMIMNCRIFRSERGALFLQPGQHRQGAEFIAAYNITRVEIEDENFRSKHACVIKALKSRKIVRKKEAVGAAGDRQSDDVDILCLPFAIAENHGGVLYLDNRFSRSEFSHYDNALLNEISVSIGHYVRRLMNFTVELEASVSTQTEPLLKAAPLRGKRFVARSLAMKELVQQVDSAASTDASVMILGETGVGKELIAQRTHLMSDRREKPFIDISLASVPETLIESELFGHEKGAFTGADKQKKGYLEIAHQGTLFVDEVGDIPHPIQVKLLRAIQEKSFYRVGGIRKIASDFRVITATNRDLKKAIEKGAFREDLYYRLNVIQLAVPPLRQRGNDGVRLARYFISRFSKRYNLPVPELSEEDKKRLRSYHWPGNVRELENVIERAVILARGDAAAFTIPQLSSEVATADDGGPDLAFAQLPTLDEIQRRYIAHVLKKTGGRLSGDDGAARILGLKRSTLYHRMKRLGMKRE